MKVDMKLWLLRPIKGVPDDPWDPWYDKAFGFVVRAADEEAARMLADQNAGDENGQDDEFHPWLNREQSTCEPLQEAGEQEVVMLDFARA